jgi:hypothetical protein
VSIFLVEYAIQSLYSVYINYLYSIKISNNLISKKQNLRRKKMAKSDLLKQAIADAKAVKETALANAKIALQEAFSPRIKEMLATKLTNEIEGEDEEMADAAVDTGAEAGTMEPGGDDFTWTDDTLAASVGGNDYSFQVGMAGEEDEEGAPAPEAAPASEEEMTAEYNEGMEMDNESPEDLNLEAIIRELEDDIESDDAMNQDVDMPVEGMYYEEEEDDMTEGMYYEDEEEDVNEIIESILREMDAEEDPNAYAPENDVVQEMEDELAAKDQELQEAYRTVKRLQSVINEVNLLNAKLLYTNKLFRNFELTEAQKMKVIENFDRAGNTRETKLVFTTLAESFARPKTKKRMVKESYSAASRPSATTAPSVATTQVLSEGFELANRWKKLAGLL